MQTISLPRAIIYQRTRMEWRCANLFWFWNMFFLYKKYITFYRMDHSVLRKEAHLHYGLVATFSLSHCDVMLCVYSWTNNCKISCKKTAREKWPSKNNTAKKLNLKVTGSIFKKIVNRKANTYWPHTFCPWKLWKGGQLAARDSD